MKAPARNARDTRWLYRIESQILTGNAFAVKHRTVEWIRRYAGRVWANEAPGGRRFPEIKFGRGVLHGSAYVSYCEGHTKIVLCPGQRNALTVTHELVHALGIQLHGRSFMRIYFPLLWRYAGYSRWFLEGLAEARGYSV